MKKIILISLIFCLTLSGVIWISCLSTAAATQPDLQITSAIITEITSSQVKYTYTIKNIGNATITNLYNVSIQNFYSANTVFNDTGDKAAGGRILGVNKSLAPGESYTVNYYASGAVPSNMNYLTFKIDWGSIITESNENNNTKYLALKPNLVFTNVKIVSVLADKINYSYTIKNNGGVTIPTLYNVSIQNFYSTNTVFNDAGDKAAGGSILAINKSLAPGESYSGTFAAYGKVPAGMKYITGMIDWGNIVNEMNENDNNFTLTIPQ